METQGKWGKTEKNGEKQGEPWEKQVMTGIKRDKLGKMGKTGKKTRKTGKKLDNKEKCGKTG